MPGVRQVPGQVQLRRRFRGRGRPLRDGRPRQRPQRDDQQI